MMLLADLTEEAIDLGLREQVGGNRRVEKGERIKQNHKISLF